MFGIVSSDDFDSQLTSLVEPKETSAKVVEINRGRGPSKEVPSELRKIIAGEAINGTSSRELSELFGVSPSSISAYKNDATSTASYNKPDEDLKKSNEIVKLRISDTARGRLEMALGNITDDKLRDAKLKDVSAVAKDMSAIIKNMEPSNPNEGKVLNQQIVFYAPKAKQETDFETIELGE